MAEVITRKESVCLKYRLLGSGVERVRYFYGPTAEDQARSWVETGPALAWYEMNRIKKTTERIGGSDA